ncbi:DUF2750 domain-containing protein [Aliiglaciecola sp. CAU 1673]|uniref:DUF2750 domain-containing protein n=1 Tax=Aliiglaciecola sp. CAU 1673 TaxID=3032595 RepID=UPI0023D9C8E2|nr:DUF2750 domain-containing protein [Aliiglaciecola sp. CAU 1673]MDF2179073.1 DUF2750 domain-containing protein [Aliiglaciecola sp. CAU 1673]
MNAELTLDMKQSVLSQTPEQRVGYFNKLIQEKKTVWTLVDDHGAMMMTAEDEDCIPVWPASEFVQDWIEGEWAHCRPHAISLKDWQDKWLPGLEDDEIQVVVFPVPGEDGLVLEPWELAERLH